DARRQLMDEAVTGLHLAVCRRFGAAVAAAAGRGERRSPCEAWDARAGLEDGIGIHDVLVLRPLGLQPHRPHDPQARWDLTYSALAAAFAPDMAAAFDKLDASRLVSNLSRDVLVHTWDLARAVGADDRLDAAWCALFYAGL